MRDLGTFHSHAVRGWVDISSIIAPCQKGDKNFLEDRADIFDFSREVLKKCK
jgi:hypothetical protein